MAVARLAVTDFRSYRHALIQPSPGLVILTGENGAGKTNLLEAVSLLAPGRGLRQAALGQVARVGGPGGFAVAARLADAVEIGTGATAAAPERRQVRINGVAAAANALAERLAVLWLTPAMDRLFAEGAAGRRRFLDRLVLALEPAHALHAGRYEAAMRARTRLLIDERVPDEAWLTALETAMAEHGEALVAARTRVVDALATRLADTEPGPFARAAIMLEGGERSDVPFRDRLRAGRARDAQAGRALEGPHRVDLLVRHRDRDVPAALCSTGEQKALLLGLVLAHADLVADRVGRRPILLLDEVAAHLDPVRRAALLDRLGAAGGQVWMTGTEPALFGDAPESAQRLVVIDGIVTDG